MSSLSGRKILQGVAFLAVLGLLLGLTIVKFQQRFPWQNTVDVALTAPRAGTQLEKNADVKLRGIVVGRVKKQDTTAEGARLTLAFNPEDVDLIPRNVSARILPKTLFGEKFVDLVIPESGASPDRLREGDTIGLDRSASALEVERVLADLFPLLRGLQPEKLARALSAISEGLQGRGDQLGQSLADLDKLLAGYEPSLGTFQEDLSGLADLAESLDANAPDLVRLAQNATVSARTVVNKEDTLFTFLRGTADFAQVTGDILTDNADRLITIAKTSVPILGVVHAYRNELPSNVRNLELLLRRLNVALNQGPALAIRLELVPGRGAYTAADRPQFPTGNGVPPGAEEAALLGDLVGLLLDVAPADVPSVVGLLWGPILRGAQAEVS